MQDICLRAAAEEGIGKEEIKKAIASSLKGRILKKVLIIPPDYTRFHSNAGFITNIYYHLLAGSGADVDIMPALGTHVPVSKEQWGKMFGDIPFDKMLVHDWKGDVVTLGEIPAQFIKSITDGLWDEPVKVQINKKITEGRYDLIISPGQVVPHEVVGMSNHSKNLFVGVGGKEMINKSHMVGAIYGMERMMGRENTPVRALFDYASEHFLKDVNVLYALTVTTAPEGRTKTHGLFIGEGRECFANAVKLSQKTNMDFVDRDIKKCVVYLDPSEFKSTWLGNKAIYRTRMAMADGGELIILAPGIKSFGENPEQDTIIRKYGYRGRDYILEKFRSSACSDLRDNMGSAAHLIHGSSDGRFSITYAVKEISEAEMESVGFRSADYDSTIKKYNPDKMTYGFNDIDGEEVFYIPNPALGLWISRKRFTEEV